MRVAKFTLRTFKDDARFRLATNVDLEGLAESSAEEVVAIRADFASEDPANLPRGLGDGGSELDSVLDNLWYVLKNVHNEPESNFECDPVEVAEVLARMGHPQHLSLWHSHRVVEGPSQTDLDFLSANARFKRGFVYHIPTARAILYTASGVVHAFTPLSGELHGS